MIALNWSNYYNFIFIDKRERENYPLLTVVIGVYQKPNGKAAAFIRAIDINVMARC